MDEQSHGGSLEKLLFGNCLDIEQVQKNIVLVGDAGCGKTHLFNIYAEKGAFIAFFANIMSTRLMLSGISPPLRALPPPPSPSLLKNN